MAEHSEDKGCMSLNTTKLCHIQKMGCLLCRALKMYHHVGMSKRKQIHIKCTEMYTETRTDAHNWPPPPLKIHLTEKLFYILRKPNLQVCVYICVKFTVI
jgi:GT2 family glycosyltransferase